MVLRSAIITGHKADSEAVHYMLQVKERSVQHNHTLGGMLLKKNNQ